MYFIYLYYRQENHIESVHRTQYLRYIYLMMIFITIGASKWNVHVNLIGICLASPSPNQCSSLIIWDQRHKPIVHDIDGTTPWLMPQANGYSKGSGYWPEASTQLISLAHFDNGAQSYSAFIVNCQGYICWSTGAIYTTRLIQSYVAFPFLH